MRLFKKLLLILSILFINSFIVLDAKADIITAGTHSVDKCVKITNSLDFSEYYTIAVINPLGIVQPGKKHGIGGSIIKPNECLTKGYKFNSLSIYLANKNYINSIGVEKFDPSTTSDSFYLLSDQIEPWGGYIKDTYAITAEDVEYSLIKSSAGVFSLKKIKDTYTYTTPNVKFIQAFALTILIEIPLIFLLLILFKSKNVSNKKIIYIGFLTNLLTLFCLWFVLIRLIPLQYYEPIGETAVFIAEAIIFKIFLKINIFKAILISLVVNMCSWFIGNILNVFGLI